MFCKKCGHERQGGEKFCPVCGTPFPEEDGNQDVVLNMTGTNQDNEGEAIDDSKDVVNTPEQEVETQIGNEVDNRQNPQSNNLSNPSNGGKGLKKVIVGVIAVFLLLIFFAWAGSSDSASNNEEDSNTEMSNNENSSDASEQSSDGGTYGPDWLHQSSFRSFTSDGDKLYLKFGGDGSFSLWENSGDDETTMLSIDGNYTVSGDNLTITLNNGTVMNYTLNEGNQSVVSSSGAEFTSVQ